MTILIYQCHINPESEKGYEPTAFRNRLGQLIWDVEQDGPTVTAPRAHTMVEEINSGATGNGFGLSNWSECWRFPYGAIASPGLEFTYVSLTYTLFKKINFKYLEISDRKRT